MDTEKINEMAQAFADKVDDGQRTARQCAVKAYMQACDDIAEGHVGARTVWHGTDEEPEPQGGDSCLYCLQGKKGNVRRVNYENPEQFRAYIERSNVRAWAYRRDLLEA